MRIFSVVLVSIFTSGSGFAAGDSQFAVHLPWTFVQEKAQAELVAQSQLTNRWPQLSFEASGITWAAQNVNVTTDLKSATVSVLPAMVSVNLPSFSAQIVLQSLNADQVITRTINGVVLNIRFRASCGPITLRQTSGKGAMSLVPVWSLQKPELQFQGVQVSWPENSWTVSDFNCTGPAGLTEVIKDEIQNYLRNPAFAQSGITQALRDVAQGAMLSDLVRTMTQFPAKIGSTTQTIHIVDLSAQASGLYLKASTNAKTTARLTPEVFTLGGTLPQTGPNVLATMDEIREILRVSFKSVDDIITIDLQKIPAFVELMNSPFMQSWAWPDLSNYPPNSPFYGRVKMPETVKLTQSKNILKMEIPMSGVIQSYRSGKWWDYVNGIGPVQADLDIKFTKGLMTYTTKVTKSTIRFTFVKSYVDQFRNVGSLPESSMNDGFLGTQKDLSGTVQWPTFATTGTKKYDAAALKSLNSKYMHLQWLPGQ